MKKRVLSLLMAIAICLSMLPSAALAEIPGTGTNEVQTEQQITDEQKPEEQKPEEQKPDEQKPDEQKPDEQKPDEQKPEEQNPDEQKPDKQNPDEQNPDEQKPAKAPRKEPAAETPTGGHANHPICGKTCSHTDNKHTNIEWKPVSSLDEITGAGNYYLTQDVTINSTWKPANGTVLCLNGYGISMTNNGPVIHVQPDVTFTLCDCNGNGGGITHKSGRGAGVLVGQSATTEDTARTNTAVFNMYGGAIYNNYPQKASGENAASASGVLIGGGTFNMYGGKITGNKLAEDGGLGGGVFVANQGSFHMSGGEISGNHATEGGGVFVGGLYGYHDFSACSGGAFTMSGGSITGNSGTGGGVYVSAGSNTSFTVSGSAQITDNTGSNVYLNKNKDGQSNTIKVDGVLDGTARIGVSVETANQVVAKNISAENKEHFFRDNDKYELQYDSTSQTLTLVGHDKHPACGDVNCKEHTTISWTAVSDLTQITKAGYYYLTQDVKIKEPWSPANEVTLCLNGHSITLASRDGSSVIEVRSGNFTLCDCSGSKGKITHGKKTNSSIKYPGIGVSVYSGTFTMYGGSITGNDSNFSGGGVYVGNATFNMYGGSITGNTVTGSGGGVYVNEKGTFNMKGGSITGNTSSSYGGGVYVYNGAEFTMTGGSITDNVAGASNENKSYGGGVYSTGTFTMTGGSITRNKAKYGGGGVWTDASFTVSGNVNITGNVNIDGKTASNVYPSLVKITIGREGLKPEAKIGVTYGNTIATGKYVTIATGAKDSCTADNFTADAGEPYGIKVESTGSGVDVNLYNGLPHEHPICGKTCSHTDNEHTNIEWKPVSDLDAITGAGNYYLTQDVTSSKTWTCSSNVNLCLNGHSITRNGDGNAINVTQNATFTLCDCDGSKAGNGKIIISSARYGVKIESNGTFFMYSGSISGTGTGVDVSSGSSKFNMYGGAIEGNTWHGVNNSGTFNMYGGVIKGNDRCGVYNTENTFNMYGGSITGNGLKDKESLGGVYVEDGTVNVSGDVTITGNTAKGNTSNVYLPAGKTITVIGALGENAKIGVTTANTPAEGSYLTIAKGIDKNSSEYTLTETDLNAFTSDVGNSYGKRLNGNSIIFTKGDLHIHALCGASCTHTGTHSEEVWKPLTYDAKTQTLYYGGTAVPNEVTKHITGYDKNNNAVYGNYRSHTLPSGNYYLTADIALTGGTVGTDTTVGGEIYIEGYNANVNLCLNGHTLSVTNANSAVISISKAQEFTMSDCKGNGKLQTADSGHSVVQAYSDNNNYKGTFTMYGGTISGARFGVWATNSGGSFNMFGGTITGNEYGVSISSNASFTIGGTVNITGNTKNVDLGENVTITIDKSLTQDARIGITIAKEPTADNPIQFATGATGELDYTGIFTPDAKDKSYVISKGDGGNLLLGLHQHSWSYTANGATITAKCTATGCPLKDKNGGSVTISASNAVYDRSSKAAAVTANDWKGDAVDSIKVTYTGRNGTNYNSTDAPTNAGEYTASITLGEGENAKTASVEYSIEKASLEYTLPVNLEAVYGSTLASVKLPTGWAWKDATQSVGSVGEKTFKATYTPDDANYHAVTDIDVTVTVNKAPVTIQIAGMPKGPIAYGDTFVLTITQTGDSSAVPAKWTKFSNDRHFEYLREQSDPEKGKFKFRATGVCTGNGCSQKFTVEFESDTHKGSLTVSTPNVTKKTLTGEDLVFGGLPTDFTKTYDGSTSFTKASVEIKSGAKVNTTDVLPAVNGSYVYNSKDVKDAQKVIFTSEKTESENYILPAGLVVERKAKIEPAAITVTPNAVSKTYGADDPVLTYGVSGAVNSETPAFTGALARAEGKNVGDYAINRGTLALADKDTFKAGNYKLKFTSKGNLTITKAKPEITAASKQITKNGVEVDITGWASFNNNDSGAKLTYTLVGAPIGITLTGNKLIADPSTVVHTFSIKVSAEATANFTAPDEVTFTVTVVNKDDAGVSITTPPTSKTYGDADFTVTAANGVTETTGNNGKWTWTSSDDSILKIVSGADSATATVQVLKASATGVTLTATYDSDTHMGTATTAAITVAPKTLTADDLEFTTDSTFTKTYDGSTSFTKASVEIRSNAKVNTTDALPAVNGSYVYNSKDVKDAEKVTFTSEKTESENYILPAGLTVEHAAGITQATPTYTVPTGLTAKYGQTLADISLPDGWAWMDSTLSVGDVSDAAKTFKVKFTPTDTNNYKTVENIKVSVTVNKADGRGLKTADLTQKFTDVSDHAYTPDWSVLPGGQNWSYNSEYRVSTGSNVTLTKHDFAADGSLLTYAVSGGKAGDKITITLKASCGNYEDFTITLNITLTAKDIPNVTAKDIVVTYDGNPIPADKITGTADVAGTWEWKAGTAVTNVSDSGTKTVVFKPADSVNYAEVEKTITVIINRATPTGEPKYTEITTGGKTLADAALMLAGGTISFDEGALEWIDEKGNKLSDETVVEANKSYTWRFTPANTNYTTLTGTIVLYPASTGIVIYTPVNDAIFLSGANQIVAPGSAATFRINKNFGEFRSVAVDGVTLDKSNYRAWSGSTYVKLTPAYMKTLSVGTHTLAVYFTGATATTTFTISAGSSNPATGASDFAGVGAAVAMAAVSLLGAAAVLRRK